MTSQHSEEEWLTLGQVCSMLNIGKYTLWKLRKRRKVLNDYYPMGKPEGDGPGGGHKLVRLKKSEVLALMEAGKVENV